MTGGEFMGQDTHLNPLHLKPIQKTKSSLPFPYSEFTRQKPEKKEPDRLRQLEQMLSGNQERAVEKEREAYDKAYAAGEKAGLALGNKRAEQILDQMQQILDAAKSQLDEIRRSACESIMDISGAVSTWLIGEITEDERGRLLEMAKKTANELPEMSDMKIAVHPDVFVQVEKLLDGSDFQHPMIADSRVKPECIRIFNKTQDVLIDPATSVAEGIAYIKAGLSPSAPVSAA